MEITYRKVGDYNIPNLDLPEEAKVPSADGVLHIRITLGTTDPLPLQQCLQTEPSGSICRKSMNRQKGCSISL